MPITPNAPTGMFGGSPFESGVPMQSTGTLSGYGSTVPALRYSFDGGLTYHGLPDVTASGWSAVIYSPQFAGSYTLTVSDGMVTGVVAFTVLPYAR